MLVSVDFILSLLVYITDGWVETQEVIREGGQANGRSKSGTDPSEGLGGDVWGGGFCFYFILFYSLLA